VVASLESRRAEERKRRAPVVVPRSLLDYAHLREIRKCLDCLDWSGLASALGAKREFGVFLDQVDDLRNAVAHSRELLPHERALLEGIAGVVRTRVTMYRSTMDTDRQHYPVIESVRDSFGNLHASPNPIESMPILTIPIVLQVGDLVSFEAKGWDAQGRDLTWTLTSGFAGRKLAEAIGTEVILEWLVSDREVGVHAGIGVTLTSSGKFHRHTHHDQLVLFSYSVDPPA
jgi:hypothetical protein